MKGNGETRVQSLYLAPDEESLSAIATDRLHSQLAERLQRLIQDLAANDLPLALLDLAQLHRTVSGCDAEQLARVRSACATATLDFVLDTQGLHRE